MDRDPFTQTMKAKAEQNFQTHGYLAAIVVAVQSQGIAAELLPMEDKDAAARLIQRFRAASPLVAVVAESWYIDLTKLAPEQQRQAMDMPPSKHPKRKEVALVTIHHGLDTTMYSADIIRKGRKKPVLGPWREAPMAGAEGRFVTPPAEWN